MAVYNTICVSTLLYACEGWTPYCRHIRSLEAFQFLCLQTRPVTSLGHQWERRVYNSFELCPIHFYKGGESPPAPPPLSYGPASVLTPGHCLPWKRWQCLNRLQKVVVRTKSSSCNGTYWKGLPCARVSMRQIQLPSWFVLMVVAAWTMFRIRPWRGHHGPWRGRSPRRGRRSGLGGDAVSTRPALPLRGWLAFFFLTKTLPTSF